MWPTEISTKSTPGFHHVADALLPVDGAAHSVHSSPTPLDVWGLKRKDLRRVQLLGKPANGKLCMWPRRASNPFSREKAFSIFIYVSQLLKKR